ncbi:Peptidoglycan-binding LysM domain-containing protein [Musa troglodytarum]|uniref:Peptidoglycan-binding LysM domain-containing protein n=1 Tax=Musa troglodytarum TaxID=320322 RepID=A0A9E7ERQ1_9LILI|nr:Peptidoglycan-binding LysM domain-containing protein [Musa troglodytarum]
MGDSAVRDDLHLRIRVPQPTEVADVIVDVEVIKKAGVSRFCWVDMSGSRREECRRLVQLIGYRLPVVAHDIRSRHDCRFDRRRRPVWMYGLYKSRSPAKMRCRHGSPGNHVEEHGARVIRGRAYLEGPCRENVDAWSDHIGLQNAGAYRVRPSR